MQAALHEQRRIQELLLVQRFVEGDILSMVHLHPQLAGPDLEPQQPETKQQSEESAAIVAVDSRNSRGLAARNMKKRPETVVFGGYDELSAEVQDSLEDLERMRPKWDGRRHWWNFFELRLFRCLAWWLQLTEPKREGLLARLTQSNVWSSIVAMLISLNAIFMVYVVDWNAATIGTDTPEPLLIEVCEPGFLAFFFIELLLNLIVHRLYFFCNKDMCWNIFDFFIVALSGYEMLLVASATSETNFTFLRSLRLLRIVRALRVIRVLRFARPLRRVLQSIIGSFHSLFWSFAVLIFVYYIFGIATVQSVTTVLDASAGSPEDEISLETRENLAKYFSSVLMAILSYYQATSSGKEWSFFFNMLWEVSPFAGSLFLSVVAFTQIALLNVLTGIFVETAMKVAIPDQEDRAMELRRAEIKDSRQLRHFVREALDIDCSGSITWDEFQRIAEDEMIGSMFAIMGMDIKDVKLFFNMVSRKDGLETEVDFEFLVEKCMKLRGPASSLDVQSLIYKTDLLTDKVNEISNRAPPPRSSNQTAL